MINHDHPGGNVMTSVADVTWNRGTCINGKRCLPFVDLRSIMFEEEVAATLPSHLRNVMHVPKSLGGCGFYPIAT